MATRIVWYLKVTAVAVLLLNWEPIVRLGPSLVQQQYAFLLVAVFLFSAAGLSLRTLLQRQQQGGRRDQYRPLGQYLLPNLFECRTTHTRLFPTKHSFSYSYLLVGVPIGWRGATIPILSSDVAIPPISTTSSSTWFSVNAEDYLARGGHVDGLTGKLRDYLAAQNASIEDYPFAYLVTAPRFLGFSFNPVSFWYLYDKTKNLAAMILEVNNTFDERRMYFLPRDGKENSQTSSKFTKQWAKDFHVSPFNDRAGSYSLSAIDPFERRSGGQALNEIDNTIVLRSDDGKPKVIARVFSTRPGINPTTISGLKILLFLARWWWVGFMTNPRILREARVLWVKGLQVFYRPEVMTTSIGRNPTPEENAIEPFFRSWLQWVSNSSNTSIKYVPAADHKHVTILYPESADYHPHSTEKTGKPGDLEIRILTPAWYAELARNSNFPTVFDQFCFNAGPGQAMAYVSDPERFHRILEDVECNLSHSPTSTYRSSTWRRLTAWLRGKHDSTLPTSDRSTRNQDLDIDAHVRRATESLQVIEYERACSKILLADRFALGLTSLIRFYVQFLRLGIWTAFIFHLNQWIHGTRGYGAWELCSFTVEVFILCMAR